MEAALTNLEQTVKKADDRLETIAWKLDEFQKGPLQSRNDVDEQVSVVELMQGINQIKEDYESLHQDLRKVQSLQKQLTHSLKNQVNQVKGSYTALRMKLSQTNL